MGKIWEGLLQRSLRRLRRAHGVERGANATATAFEISTGIVGVFIAYALCDQVGTTGLELWLAFCAVWCFVNIMNSNCVAFVTPLSHNLLLIIDNLSFSSISFSLLLHSVSLSLYPRFSSQIYTVSAPTKSSFTTIGLYRASKRWISSTRLTTNGC